jgi:hypothetical protein
MYRDLAYQVSHYHLQNPWCYTNALSAIEIAAETKND